MVHLQDDQQICRGNEKCCFPGKTPTSLIVILPESFIDIFLVAFGLYILSSFNSESKYGHFIDQRLLSCSLICHCQKKKKKDDSNPVTCNRELGIWWDSMGWNFKVSTSSVHLLVSEFLSY